MLGDEPLGPPRVWLRDVNVPGLCMTRSFGDGVAATVGVIDTPEVVTYGLKPEDRWGGVGVGWELGAKGSGSGCQVGAAVHGGVLCVHGTVRLPPLISPPLICVALILLLLPCLC
jgi:hypothetical protein